MASNKQHHQLTINNLWEVYQALISIAHKYKVVGLGIGIPSNELEDIDKDNRDSKKKLYSMLGYRLRQEPLLTWENIVRVLRSPGISESALASQIENVYLSRSSSLPVPSTSVSSVREILDISGPSQQLLHQSYHHVPHPSPHQVSFQQNLPYPSNPYSLVPHNPLYYQPAAYQEQSTLHYTNQPGYMHQVPPGQYNMPGYRLGSDSLHRTEQYRYSAPTQQQFLQPYYHPVRQQIHQQSYIPHIQQQISPSERMHLPHPTFQLQAQPSQQQTPYLEPVYHSDGMHDSSNPLDNPNNRSQQSLSPHQPSSIHNISTPSQQLNPQTPSQQPSPQQVSPNYRQTPPPGPPPKRPRLDPSASARQQSVPTPSPSSSMPVASPTPKPHSKVYSEVMQNYIHYVKNIYKSRKVETYVKFSLNPTKVYINLALMDRQVVEHKAYKDITVAMVQDGNVDAIQKKKGQIELNKIACGIPDPSSGSDSEEDRRLILVEGAPGVGKSTFAWEYCRRWLHGSVAQQYDLVLLLRLRDERIKSAKGLIELLYHPSENVSSKVFDELINTNRYNVLMILEGYDELPDSVRQNSSCVFNKIISGELLPLATILVTSRPWATEDIRKMHECRIFQHIEVLGFTKRQIKEYIKETVPAEKVSDITAYLERHPQIRSGMYIPLNSAIVVAVYLASEKGTQDLPKTQTELYTALIGVLIARHMESHPKLKESIKVDLPSLGKPVPSEVYQNFIHLSKIAYEGIVESGDEVKLIFSESELPPNFDNLGFMDSVTDLYVNQELKSSHNFLHLTFQEFFAAAHISTMPSEKQIEYYRESIGKKGGRLDVVLRFLAGLKKLDCFTNESAMIITEQSDHKPPSEFRSPPECMIGIDVVNWMFEAQSADKISLILGERKVEFKATKISMLPMDYYSLGYCISHSQCQWVLSLTGKMGISKEKIGILAEGATGSGFTGRIVEFGDDVLRKLSKEALNSLFAKWISFLSFELYIEKREFRYCILNNV